MIDWLLDFWQFAGVYIVIFLWGLVVPLGWYNIFAIPVIFYLTFLVEKLIFKLSKKD